MRMYDKLVRARAHAVRAMEGARYYVLCETCVDMFRHRYEYSTNALIIETQNCQKAERPFSPLMIFATSGLFQAAPQPPLQIFAAWFGIGTILRRQSPPLL